MFKSRLKELGINVLICLSVIVGIALFASIAYFLDSKITISDEAVNLFLKLLGISLAIYFIYKVIASVAKFINWLFIEPFKKVK